MIEGYTVRLNPQALDIGDTVLVQVTLDSHSDNTLEKFGGSRPASRKWWRRTWSLAISLLPAARGGQGHARLRAPAARALQDQGYTPQPPVQGVAHAQADLPCSPG